MLVGFALLIVALMAAFAFLVVHSQSQSQKQAQQRFNAEASIAAQLTASLFTSSTTSSEAAAAKAFGSRVIERGALDALAKKSGLLYLLILDQKGTVIASSSGAPSSVLTRPAAEQAHIRAALLGEPSLSDLLPARAAAQVGVLEWALPFTTSFGRRVEVEALFPTLI